MGAAGKSKEDRTKLTTANALTRKTEAGLTPLLTDISKALALTEPATADRRNVLASLETIARAWALQM